MIMLMRASSCVSMLYLSKRLYMFVRWQPSSCASQTTLLPSCFSCSRSLLPMCMAVGLLYVFENKRARVPFRPSFKQASPNAVTEMNLHIHPRRYICQGNTAWVPYAHVHIQQVSGRGSLFPSVKLNLANLFEKDKSTLRLSCSLPISPGRCVAKLQQIFNIAKQIKRKNTLSNKKK